MMCMDGVNPESAVEDSYILHYGDGILSQGSESEYFETI